MGEPIGQKKKNVGKIDLFHQPLRHIDMACDLLKQKLFQGMIIGKRKSNKAFA